MSTETATAGKTESEISDPSTPATESSPSTSPSPSPKPGHVVCRVGEIPEGGRKIVQIGNKSIGVFHLKGGRFYALLNVCPHQLAPLCAGKITGTMGFTDKVGEYTWQREGEIVRCPWHAWEFDITTGRSIFNPHKVRTRAYPVSVAQSDLAAETESAQTPDSAPASACHPDRPAGSSSAKGVEAESVESYPVSVEDNLIVVHI
ncbi:MAG: Rieske (2Fe-2S) protein [Candidatus Methylacidiphilales bacterium]